MGRIASGLLAILIGVGLMAGIQILGLATIFVCLQVGVITLFRRQDQTDWVTVSIWISLGFALCGFIAGTAWGWRRLRRRITPTVVEDRARPTSR